MFELDVVSDPGAALAPDSPMWQADLRRLVDYDTALVKPSLLFADQVTLFSFRASMRQRAWHEGFRLRYQPVRVLREFVEVAAARDAYDLKLLGLDESQLPPSDYARALLRLLENYESMDQKVLDQFYQFESTYSDEFAEYLNRASQVWERRWEALDSVELKEAVSTGILRVDGWTNDKDYPAHMLKTFMTGLPTKYLHILCRRVMYR